MPASKVTRVRRLGFWKSIARVRPESGGAACRRVARNSVLSVVAVANTRSISARVRSAAREQVAASQVAVNGDHRAR